MFFYVVYTLFEYLRIVIYLCIEFGFLRRLSLALQYLYRALWRHLLRPYANEQLAFLFVLALSFIWLRFALLFSLSFLFTFLN